MLQHSAALARLHATLDTDALFRPMTGLIQQEVRFSAATLTSRSIENERWMSLEFHDGRLCPAEILRSAIQHDIIGAWLMQRPGTPCFHLSRIEPDRNRLKRTPFYREVMLPQHYEYAAGMVFWENGNPAGVVCVHREGAARDFTDAEMAFLAWAAPHAHTAWRRNRRLSKERRLTGLLEKIVRDLPSPALLLDGNLNLVLANGAAFRTCALWNLGPKAEAYNPRDIFQLPDPIASLCRREKELWEKGMIELFNCGQEPALTVPPPRAELSTARIRVLHLDEAPSAGPAFLVDWESSGPGSAGNQIPVLAALSPAERQVVLAVSRGKTNDEAAAGLGKSTHTVKKQLASACRKLGVRDRRHLALLLGKERNTT